MMSVMPSEVVDELRALASAFGGVAWVQGAGGNVSVKQGGDLYVKASGTLLAEVHESRNVAVAPLELVTRGFEDAGAERELFDRSPRPSMETWFHALPFPVVAHTHPAAVLALACSDRSAPVFPGVTTVDLEYVRPGKELAIAMFEALPAGCAEVVFLLRNHGLVVGAASAARAIELSRRFAAACLEAAGISDFEASLAGVVAEWSGAPVIDVGGLVARALPSRTRHRGRRRKDLFPDAIVYGVPWPVELATLEALPIRVALTRGDGAPTRLMEDDAGRRFLVSRDRSALDRATSIAAVHEWVEARVPLSHLRFLPDGESAALLAMPSEKHRQAIV